MNTSRTHQLVLGLLSATCLALTTHGQETKPATATPTAADSPKPSSSGTNAAPTEVAKVPVEPAPAPEPLPNAPDGSPMLRLNFRGAPLETVLNYLSEAAGYIIVLDTEVRGRIDAWSAQPVTREEALQILENALGKNGYTAIRNGRTLTVVSKENARKRNIPVKSGSNPESIPKDEQVVTQIIPIRYISATALTQDLQPLLPAEANMTANEAGNALVITDTQASIHRLTEIIRALDTSLASNTSVRIFSLRFADAKELATVIKDIFAVQDSGTSAGNRGGNNAGGNRGGFGGFPGGFGGMAAGGFGGNAGGGNRGGGSGSGRAAASKVVAVADEYSNSLIVNAPEDAMPTIEELIRTVDTNVQDVTELRVFRLQYADPSEMADVLSNLFPDPTKAGNQNTGQVRFGGGFNPFGNRGGGGGGTAGASTGSERAKKKNRVIAVPDLRTSSVIVSADRELMEQIAEMVKQLDANPAKKQQVFVYDLQNADPQQVQNVLRGLFQRQGVNNLNSQNQNQMNSALVSRYTQQIQNNVSRGSSSGGFGSGAGGGGGGTGGGGFGRGN